MRIRCVGLAIHKEIGFAGVRLGKVRGPVEAHDLRLNTGRNKIALNGLTNLFGLGEIILMVNLEMEQRLLKMNLFK